MSTLDDLKRAIDAVGRRPFADGDYFTTSRLCDWQSRRADAWRTAFGWRESWRSRSHDIAPQSIQWSAHCDEGDEGMRLIREKLS